MTALNQAVQSRGWIRTKGPSLFLRPMVYLYAR